MGLFNFFKSDDSNNSSKNKSDLDKNISERNSNQESKKDDDIDIDETIQSSLFMAAAIDG